MWWSKAMILHISTREMFRVWIFHALQLMAFGILASSNGNVKEPGTRGLGCCRNSLLPEMCCSHSCKASVILRYTWRSPMFGSWPGSLLKKTTAVDGWRSPGRWNSPDIMVSFPGNQPYTCRVDALPTWVYVLLCIYTYIYILYIHIILYSRLIWYLSI